MPKNEYVCPRCHYTTTKKLQIKQHFEKVCQSETPIELTTEIKEYVMKNYIYVNPPQEITNNSSDKIDNHHEDSVDQSIELEKFCSLIEEILESGKFPLLIEEMMKTEKYRLLLVEMMKNLIDVAPKKKPPNRKTVPAPLKIELWTTYIGSSLEGKL